MKDGKPEDASLLKDGKPDVASLFVKRGMRGGLDVANGTFQNSSYISMLLDLISWLKETYKPVKLKLKIETDRKKSTNGWLLAFRDRTLIIFVMVNVFFTF